MMQTEHDDPQHCASQLYITTSTVHVKVNTHRKSTRLRLLSHHRHIYFVSWIGRTSVVTNCTHCASNHTDYLATGTTLVCLAVGLPGCDLQ